MQEILRIFDTQLYRSDGASAIRMRTNWWKQEIINKETIIILWTKYLQNEIRTWIRNFNLHNTEQLHHSRLK